MLKPTKLTPIRDGEFQINLFQKKEIRKVFHKNEWWFSVNDVVEALTDSRDIKQYIRDMRKRDPELASNWGEIITPVEMIADDGKRRRVSSINVEGIFRLIQSIPSKNAETFKKWLAKVGYERIQEFQNPELTVKRAILAYKIKGYDDGWIKTRIGTIQSRRDLTDEWKKRGVKGIDYAILTDAISVKTFSLTPKKHKKIKKLGKSHLLRDNMTPVELALTMLGETSTVKIAQKIDARGLKENKQAAEEGGDIAGDARKALEKRLGISVVSKQNYLTDRQKQNVIKNKREQNRKLLEKSKKK